jgi:hypothetical protein
VISSSNPIGLKAPESRIFNQEEFSKATGIATNRFPKAAGLDLCSFLHRVSSGFLFA